MPKVLSLAWEKFFEIQHAQPEDIQELLHKLHKDLQIINEELAEYINSPSWNRHAFYDDDDDDEYSIQYKEYLENSSNAIASKEPNNSLSMGDEYLSTISETESDEVIKSSVENLVPIPSDNDESFSDEDVLKEIFNIYSNPLFDDEICSSKIDPHHFNAESDFIESFLNRDILMVSYPKFDSFLEEFFGELAHIDLVPPRINKADFDPEEEIHLIEEFFYDNSSPRPLKESNSEISDATIESSSPSPIPVEDSDSLIEEINLFLDLDDSIPQGIESDDYDSEGDILFLEELLSNDSLSLPKTESFHFDHYDVLTFPHPPAMSLGSSLSESLLFVGIDWNALSNVSPSRDMPKVLSLAWEKFFEIQHAQPEDIQELLHKLHKDLQIINEELAEYINSPSWNRHAFYDDDDDDEYSIQYKEYLENSSNAIASKEPNNSLSMGDEYLSTISETESDEVIKSSVENLVPIPSDNDESFSDEDVLKEIFNIYSNPLFDDEICSSKIDPHHFNAESDFIESFLNRDILMVSYPKFDSFLEEFFGELAHIDLVPPRINKADFDPEEEIHLIEEFFYDNSSPRPLKESNSEISDATIESSSPSPIPVEDSDSLIEEINLFLDLDDSIPQGIESDDYDSEGDILFLEELLSNDSLSLPKTESFHFDHYDVLTFPHPPAMSLGSSLSESLLFVGIDWNALSNVSPSRETPKVLSLAWEKFFEIQDAQPEDIQELLHKLLKDLQIINEELAEYINSLSLNRPAFYDDDDEYSIQYKEYLENSSNAIASKEPDNSLSMGDEHLSTISETDDKSFSDEDVPKENFKIYSNPLFDDEIISSKIDSHHFNVESDLIESLLNRDISTVSYPMFDSFLEEFSSELAFIDLVPPGINKTNFNPEEEIHLIEELLYDNSSPRPLEESNFEISDATIESSSQSSIPIEDNDSLMEEIDLFLDPDDLILPGIESDDSDSERDILFLEELLSNDSLSFPETESFHFDHCDVLTFPHPPEKPPDDGIFFDFKPDTGVLTAKVVEDISEHYALMTKPFPSQPTLCPNIDTLLPFSS
nr:hypothetical protein [Tanacetum cinerariifolium]